MACSCQNINSSSADQCDCLGCATARGAEETRKWAGAGQGGSHGLRGEALAQTSTKRAGVTKATATLSSGAAGSTLRRATSLAQGGLSRIKAGGLPAGLSAAATSGSNASGFGSLWEASRANPSGLSSAAWADANGGGGSARRAAGFKQRRHAAPAGPARPAGPMLRATLGGALGTNLCSETPVICIDTYDEVDCVSCPCYVATQPADAYYQELASSDFWALDWFTEYMIPVDYHGTRENQYTDDSPYVGGAVNGTLLTTPAAAHEAHPDVWFEEVPPDLLADWNAQFFPDTPGLYWTYAHISPDDSACFSELVVNNDDLVTEGGYIASGVQPYVVYSVLTNTSLSGLVRVHRVRIWVGASHHFSIFIPPPDTSTLSPPYTTDVLHDYNAYGGTMWDLTDASDPLSGDVYARGRLADMFTSLLDRVTFYTSHIDPSTSNAAARNYVYSCNPTENYAPIDMFGTENRYSQESYQSTNDPGYPASNAFSNPKAKDETDDSHAEMTAFLGATAWGDVCIMGSASDPQPLHKTLAQKAFEMLFGEWTSVAYELKGRGRTADGVFDPDFTVNRWFRLDASMLQSVTAFRDGITALRATDYGRYVIRDWDSSRMAKDAKKSRGLACDCGVYTYGDPQPHDSSLPEWDTPWPS